MELQSTSMALPYRFLSSNTQDFIEVRKGSDGIERQDIPEL